MLPAILILAVADLGDAIFRSARLFLIEQALCRDYYRIEDPAIIAPDGSVEEYRCKSDSLQADVSMVYGLFDVLTLLCGKSQNSHPRSLVRCGWVESDSPRVCRPPRDTSIYSVNVYYRPPF
jgi:hypothetical protein